MLGEQKCLQAEVDTHSTRFATRYLSAWQWTEEVIESKLSVLAESVLAEMLAPPSAQSTALSKSACAPQHCNFPPAAAGCNGSELHNSHRELSWNTAPKWWGYPTLTLNSAPGTLRPQPLHANPLIANKIKVRKRHDVTSHDIPTQRSNTLKSCNPSKHPNSSFFFFKSPKKPKKKKSHRYRAPQLPPQQQC